MVGKVEGVGDAESLVAVGAVDGGAAKAFLVRLRCLCKDQFSAAVWLNAIWKKPSDAPIAVSPLPTNAADDLGEPETYHGPACDYLSDIWRQ